MNKPLLKWSPAVAIRKPDNIISSQAEPAFIPSYYKSEKRENMNFIMSNEYMRMWFKERSIYERNIYTRQEIIKEESRIKRRIIQRLMTYRKRTKNQNLEDSVQRIFLKKDTTLEKKRLSMKYKIECPRKSNSKPGDKAGQEKMGKKSKSLKSDERNTDQKTEDDDGVCILECEQEK